MRPDVRMKRVYAPTSPDDGYRVLVDRLWPRGLTKTEAAFDFWLKDAAPSTELRKWFNHDPGRWDEFQRRYRNELRGSPALEQLHALSRTGPLTLLYAARDAVHNEAAVLVALLRQGMG